MITNLIISYINFFIKNKNTRIRNIKPQTNKQNRNYSLKYHNHNDC